jgi:hypothetical protein
VGIPEIKRYGHPLFWLITNLNGPSEYIITNLVLDMVFWVTISFIALFVISKISDKLEITVDSKNLLLPLILFVPLGLIMDVIHELEHGVFGTLVGGRLTYIQIAYFIIYPRLAVTPEFQLGAAGKIVPSYYVTDALTSLFLRGAAITSPLLLLDITILSIFSIAILLMA